MNTRTDVLRWPVIGRFLRWKHARTSLQTALLIAAAILVLHGFLGPDVAPANLATVLTWVHYRGLLIVALLAAGNFFCAGCPFVLARDGARRLHSPILHWPKRLRGKWLALVLFVAVLFCYELFDLWALPRATAYLVLAYFAAALVIDTIFKGATFCKHLCPIGQFNFIASTMSPLELEIRERSTCQACTTSDCIAGRRLPQSPQVVVQRGCELGLFLPGKVGNIDCTFCLDCVHACPHDNIALAARTPALELADARRRSGIGRLTARPDIALLAVLFVFGALMNAFAMIGPVHQLEDVARGGAGDTLGGADPRIDVRSRTRVGAGPLVGWRGRGDTSVDRHPVPRFTDRHALRLRSGAAGIRSVAGTLRLPFPDGGFDDSSRDPECGDRSVSAGRRWASRCGGGPGCVPGRSFPSSWVAFFLERRVRSA